MLNHFEVLRLLRKKRKALSKNQNDYLQQWQGVEEGCLIHFKYMLSLIYVFTDVSL